MQEQVFIQVRFQEETEVGTFSDAIYFSQDEYFLKTKEEIDDMKSERVKNYIQAVKNPPIPPEPTKEELQAQVKQLEDYKIEVEKQIVDLNIKIGEK